MSSGGQILGGIAGGIVGFFTPAGPWLGAQIGLSLGGYLDPPKGPTVHGPTLDDLTVQTSTYGATVPRIYGTVSVVGNVFWLENNQYKPTVTKKKSGGKGGAKKTTTYTTTYSATFAVALCKGPIVGIRRLWIRADLVYDAGSSDPDTVAASNQSADGWTLYPGSDTQGADPRLQATLGVDNTPAWRGVAYLVFEDLQLERYGNSLLGAQIKAELFSNGENVTQATLAHIPYVGGRYSWLPGFAAFVGVAISKAPTTPGTSLCMTTLDGLNWTAGTLPASRKWTCIYGNGTKICAVAGPSLPDDCRAIVTGDGITWTSTALSYRGWSAVGHNGSVWCIGANGYVAISANDGVAWTDYAVAGMPTAPSCVFSHGSRIILSYEGSATYATSDNNGATWVSRTFPFGANTGLRCAASDGTIIIGIVKSTGNCSISLDGGLTWGAQTEMVAGQGPWLGIAYGPGSGLFLAHLGNSYAVSGDGVSWEFYTLPETNDTFYNINTMAWTGTAWAVVPTSTSDDCYIVRQEIIASAVPLSEIVSSECLQSGLLSTSDIDVTALTADVRGYRIGSVGTLRSALEPLQAAFPFDIVQRGYKLTFKPRGGASVATIAAGDLDARGADQEAGVQITRSRETDSQLPRRLTVRYLDSAREYDAGSQYAERLAAATIRETLVDLPIVFDAGEAAGKAEVLLYAAWLSRLQISFNLPATYLHLEPADVVTLPTQDGSITVRLTEVNYTSDGRLECRAMLEHAAVYTPAAIGVEASTTGPTTLSPLGASTYALLDIPRLSSAQDGVGFPVAMCGGNSAWPGGVLMRSADAGATYDEPLDFAPPGATIGTASTTIGAVESRLIDAASRLTVTLTSGELSDVSELSLLGGANHFAYGAAGRWEIIAARTCTLQTGTTYILSNLLRGRFGSEWAMGLHAAGDTLVLLDSADLQMLPQGNADIGASRLYRAITSGRDFSTDSDRAMTYAAVNLKPLSPVYLNGSRHPGTADWSLEWIRRTRVGGEWLDGVDAELGEASEAYDIEVYADGSYGAVKRTIAAAGPSCAYPSADQVSDFGSDQATLYLKVYQRSATVGRGYPLTTSITR